MLRPHNPKIGRPLPPKLLLIKRCSGGQPLREGARMATRAVAYLRDALATVSAITNFDENTRVP
eukprot:3268082-Lingulodinium_polyedra.AAC.1